MNKIILLILILATKSFAEENNYLPDYLKYNDGLLYDLNEDFRLKTTGRLHNESNYIENDLSTEIRRARLEFLLENSKYNFGYQLSLDFRDSNSSLTIKPEDRDHYIFYKPESDIEFRLGQIRGILSNQSNTSSRFLQFTNRGLAADYFALGFSRGLYFRKDLANNKISFKTYINNGKTHINTGNEIEDSSETYSTSLQHKLIGEIDDNYESDLKRLDTLRISHGTSFSYSKDSKIQNNEFDTKRFSYNFNLKYKGFSNHSEFYYGDFDYNNSNPYGFFFQNGYFLSPKIELAYKYGRLNCDNGDAPYSCSNINKIIENGVSLNYFIHNYNIRAQLSYLNEEIDNTNSKKSNDESINLLLSFYF